MKGVLMDKSYVSHLVPMKNGEKTLCGLDIKLGKSSIGMATCSCKSCCSMYRVNINKERAGSYCQPALLFV